MDSVLFHAVHRHRVQLCGGWLAQQQKAVILATRCAYVTINDGSDIGVFRVFNRMGPHKFRSHTYYSKAYDRVNQNTLLRKMIAMNVPQFAVRWLFSFLKGRIQRVKLRRPNTFSDWIEITAGMPQGTWLGPLAFVTYIDDLNPQCVVHKFIDDTTLTEILLKGNESAAIPLPNFGVLWNYCN